MKLKKIIYLFSILLFSNFTCNKEESTKMTVVKDCTGVYLRFNAKDYQVCNEEKLDSYSDGTELDIVYQNITSCPSLNNKIICMMYHAREGWIEVKSIGK